MQGGGIIMTGEKNRGTTTEKLWNLEDRSLITPEHDELVMWLLNMNNIKSIFPNAIKVRSEVPINAPNKFLVGFWDIVVGGNGGEIIAFIEVKPRITSFGQTLRQLQTYQNYTSISKDKTYLFSKENGFVGAFETQEIKVILLKDNKAVVIDESKVNYNIEKEVSLQEKPKRQLKSHPEKPKISSHDTKHINLEKILITEREEKNRIIPVYPDFYENVAKQLNNLEIEKQSLDPFSTKYAIVDDEIKTTKNAIATIIIKRISKIFNAVRYYNTPDITQNIIQSNKELVNTLTPSENELFIKLSNDLTEWYKNVQKLIK